MPWEHDVTCEAHFHQMLFWESEYPEYTLEVHNLMVLAYHLQHPHLYSAEGLTHAKGLLVDFVEHGLSIEEVLKRQRVAMDSGKRQFKITARADFQGSYMHPIVWMITVRNITTGSIEEYSDNIRRWAQSILDTLKITKNL
jgi:hypothetical protein